MSVIHDQDQPEKGICPLDAASSSDTRLKVVNSVGNIDSVSKVAGSDNKTATADSIGLVAESKCLLWREVGDLATLLLVASVAVKHNTSDLVLDGSGETPDGSNHNSGALRVATSDDFRVWTFGVCEVEEALGLAVGSARGAFGKKVRSEGGIIGASNTLASDIAGTVGGLQAITSRGANGITLFNKNMSAEGGHIGWTMGMLTKLPASVDPRAKMNVMGRQLPLVSSLTVVPTPPACLRVSMAVGRAAAVPARRVTAAVNFISADRLLSGYIFKGVLVVREGGERG